MDEQALPDFRGRVVGVRISGLPAQDGLYLVDPYFQEQGGRLFLVGTTPGTYSFAHKNGGGGMGSH
jgi:hypothetical protein